MKHKHSDDYDEHMTLLCERALVTLIGDIGPWSERIVLVGGLAPRYIVGSLPLSATPHVGTTDIDLVIEIAIEDAGEAYETLQTNLKKAGFTIHRPSFRWSRKVDGMTVGVDFLCETADGEVGRIYQPKQETGSNFGAINTSGAGLVARDFVEFSVEAERLDEGGWSKVAFRVAGLLPYVVLKILAFQDRHENKDAYDLVYTLMNYPQGGPSFAGQVAAASAVRQERLVIDALQLLGDRFASIDHDGPIAYSNFLADSEDDDQRARLRNEAVLSVRQFLTGADGSGTLR